MEHGLSTALTKDRDSGVVARTKVKPVSNAIAIMRYLSNSDTPLRSSEIARQLSINPSTCFNILRTLVAEDVVEFDDAGKTYQVGVGLRQLAGGALSEQKKMAKARQYLHAFAEEHGVTATLWRVSGSDRMVLEIVEYSPSGMRVHMPTGQRLPIMMGATGRAILKKTGITKATAQKQFRKLRWAKKLSFEEYWRDAEKAAALGWSKDDGYFSQGVITFASPILDESGTLHFSVVAASIREQIKTAEIDGLGDDLKELRQKLESFLL